MKNAFFLATIVGIAFISCKDELKPQESFVDYSAKASTTTTQNPATNAGLNTNQQIATTTSKVNPPHGQPGHVCGTEGQQQTISTQAQPNNNQQYTINQPVTKTITPTPAKTAKGMNPPHGQPGHRCDIAVGAPLNSKPAPVAINKSSQVTTQTNTTQNGGFSVTPVDPTKQNNTPALLTPNSGQTGTTDVGTNPPHGQPGHVCGTPATTTTTETKEVK
ncbi:hypothetical protein EQG63_04490 [Flavobacterium amnicola]|uniref:Lipoprotein n=1 Tax=Flavobacterium amnicola TaxID=2506422 RepID=A0A4Q1K6G0_9FLAO|nr:hypothetical protein [Flavobacterium amnicola]RXR21202.1 hypothetical protein EQG63_04490 [Flavobacterium amnicola]